MTLQEKIRYIQTVLAAIHTDVASALTIQGLYREPEDFYLQDIGDLIRMIKTEDFQFRFDFKALDSVGRIHARNEGQSTGGSGISPTMVPNTPWWFVMDLSCPVTLVQFPEAYANGQIWGGLTTNSSMQDITWVTLDFKSCTSMPDVLVPMPEETTTISEVV